MVKEDGISMNQFITAAVTEKISALLTEEYLQKRAQQGSRRDFERALSQVPDEEPPAFDRL
jgi:hypothetical protein